MMEPGELLEDSWFFGNLLDRKSRMSRSFSDPCTSSNFNAEEIMSDKTYEETYAAITKRDDEATRPKLTRAQSSLERQGHNVTGKGSDSRGGKSSSNRKSASASNALRRTPSLPTSLEKEEFQDEEVEFSMGKLIRQASMNYSDRSLPPRQHAAKAITRSASISRQRSRRKPELESIKIQNLEEPNPPQRQLNHLKSQKTLTDLEFEELQGFKDLGFDFDEKDLSPTIAKIIPGLQENKRTDEDGDKATRRPYLSEKWAAQSYAPPVPRWGRGGKRPTEDMKAQIKFWARAVASNVRQEC